MLRGSNFQKPYPPEFRREAVALYRRGGATLREVARDLGVSSESLRLWVKQAAIDAGETNGLSTEERQELRELRLLAEELPPARAYPPRRRLQTSSEQQPAHGARRHTHAELQQFTRDPRVAPTWLLACEPQHELTHAIVDWRAAPASSRLRLLAPNQLPVPTQQRLRRHYKRVSPPRRQYPGERSEKSTIGRPQRRSSRLPPEHEKLMTQHQKLEVLGELVASPSDQQLQDRRESEISERKEHPPILAGPLADHGETEPSLNVTRAVA